MDANCEEYVELKVDHEILKQKYVATAAEADRSHIACAAVSLVHLLSNNYHMILTTIRSKLRVSITSSIACLAKVSHDLKNETETIVGRL